MTIEITEEARTLLSEAYMEYGPDGQYPTYAELALHGQGCFTLCSLRAIQRALDKKTDDYEAWYEEAIEASNEVGYACMSAAEVIRCQEAEIQRLREYEFMYKELCN